MLVISVCPSFKKLSQLNVYFDQNLREAAGTQLTMRRHYYLNKNGAGTEIKNLFRPVSARSGPTNWSYLQKLPFYRGLEKFSILSQKEKNFPILFIKQTIAFFVGRPGIG